MAPAEVTKFCELFAAVRKNFTTRQLREFIRSQDNSEFIKAVVTLLRNSCVQPLLRPGKELWHSLRKYKEKIRLLVDPAISIKRKREILLKALPLVRQVAQLVVSPCLLRKYI